MKAEKYNYMEKMTLYIAQRSVGRSIPVLVHKVPRPENLAQTLQEMLAEK